MTGAAAASAVELSRVRFAYKAGHDVLSIDSLTIARGETVFLHGPSGSGKTTLLGLLAGVLQATSGEVRVLGENFAAMSSGARDAFRARHLGYVFQMFNLIPYLSVRENILLPIRLEPLRRQRLGAQSFDAAVQDVASQLDIARYLDSPIAELSVGQQQRVAAARALIGHPEVVIADEPTSALDTDRREQFLELLFRSCEKAGATLIFVSHDHTLMPLFSRIVELAEINKAAQRAGAGA
ncbi:MAG TPA: ABC transporter ATP-binding protein [Gemmatimonas aurantiaca]|uniref:ABC transporter ATP-binding protein n=2 Tax=Gemmatimonas aurantiaca TaxID=173480 RepID=A0A3D4VC59_9BACT|nr:ABC transporter ATP-binding protein [Gemmatimonas aurantiaca]BAH37673.1 putative ABC transporter ATP-binding protein [Gemmatimonas aurantiaca T-27]HCT58709.1 ABC transporter ATP-binding protein [Gemmatimonas aurantiaca]